MGVKKLARPGRNESSAAVPAEEQVVLWETLLNPNSEAKRERETVLGGVLTPCSQDILFEEKDRES